MSWAVVLLVGRSCGCRDINVLLWARAALRLRFLRPRLSGKLRRTRTLQLWLSAGVCRRLRLPFPGAGVRRTEDCDDRFAAGQRADGPQRGDRGRYSAAWCR
jgi:hypothetical protein